MNSAIKRVLKFIIPSVFILLSPGLNGQTPKSNEAGNPFIRNYTHKEYNAHHQNWAVVQDKRGVMYIGNGDGVLEFDGHYWRLIRVSNHSLVRSLAIDAEGTIYAGAVGEFGCLAPDTAGQLNYISLTHHLKDEDKNFTDVWSIHVTTRGIYFKTTPKIFHYYNGKINVIPVASNPFAFAVMNEIIIHSDGLYVLKEKEPRLLLHTKELSKDVTRLLFILPYKDDQILIATQNKGFYIYNLAPPPSILKRFPTEIDDYILYNLLYLSKKISPHRYAFSTLNGGIVIMDDKGKLVRIINKNRGLQKNMVHDIFVDRHQNLWAALNNGISYIELNSPITLFNEKNGLEETVLCITRHRGQLYVGAIDGLYYLPAYKSEPLNDNHCFLRVKNINSGCWAFVKTKRALFAGGNFGVIRIDDPLDKRVYVKELVYCFGHSRTFPRHIFLGHRNGLAALEIKPQDAEVMKGTKRNERNLEIKHISKDKFKDVHGKIRKIIEDNHGNLWLTTQYNGIIYLRFTGKDITNFRMCRLGTKHGLPRMDWNWVYLLPANKQIIAATQKGIYKVDIPTDPGFDPGTLRFIPESTFAKPINDVSPAVEHIYFDNQGRVWIVADEGLGILSPDQKGTFQWTRNPFKKIEGEIQKIWVEDKGIAWICTSDGLFRYDSSVKKNYEADYQALIRKVSLHNNDPVIFYDANTNTSKGINQQPDASGPVFKYKDNSIMFEYAAPFYEHAEANRFNYILEGFDKEWSGWTVDTKTVYTNLPEGNYCFKVKAKNIFEHESKAAVFNFSVSPPWQRTIFAYIGYGIGLLIIIILAYAAHRQHLKHAILQEQRKYEKCHLDPQKTEEYKKKLLHFMETQKPYLDNELCLSSLSKAVGIQRHYISQILNLKLKQTFWNFVNEYRINEAKKLLSHPGKKNLSILQVAYEVGFNSGVSFNRAFKRHTGMTPSKYKSTCIKG
ncbi:MAG: helix-turn-helix domain-containing protein [Candidatus Aminicenantes bacterium]|nr:helix-turn-helix domain-containing protein [Candidatus Aminicenantes bacterium]